MKSILSRWFMFGLLVGWALSHTTVFGQPGASLPQKAQPLSAAEKLRQASPHWMRHTHATHALARGAELTTVGFVVGHRTVTQVAVQERRMRRIDADLERLQPVAMPQALEREAVAPRR